MKIKGTFKTLALCITITVFCVTGVYSATLKNISNRPVLVRLNSGVEIRIVPKETRQVDDREVKGNAKIEKLVRDHVLQLVWLTPVRKK